MATEEAIILTQIPIAVGIFIGVYEMYRIRKVLMNKK